MAGEWESKTLAELAAHTERPFAMGPFGSNIRAENYRASGVPVIRGLNLSGPGGPRFIDSDFAFLSEEKADELSSSNAFPGDLVFVAQGTIGKVGLIPFESTYKRYILSQNLMKVSIASDAADPMFVLYYFRSQAGQHEILSRANPTGVPCISKPLTSLKSFEVSLPTPTEQHAIACILGALDDKIELNRRMNETLEGIARAIFKSWFVDFLPVRAKQRARTCLRAARKQAQTGDPVRAKAAGQQPSLSAVPSACASHLPAQAGADRGTAQAGGLAPHIADLFPDAFEESELGEIPRGWDVASVGDACEFAYGKSLKASKRNSGNVPVLGSNGQIGWHDISLVTGPGIIVGRKGNPGIVTWVNSDFFPIDTTFYVVPRLTWVPLTYLCYALIDLDLPQLSADSAVPGLNRNIAYMSQLLLPSREILEVFARHTRLIMDRVYQGEQENRTLAALRDVLLPRLISGEMRVQDAERIVGRCIG